MDSTPYLYKLSGVNAQGIIRTLIELWGQDYFCYDPVNPYLVLPMKREDLHRQLRDGSLPIRDLSPFDFQVDTKHLSIDPPNPSFTAAVSCRVKRTGIRTRNKCPWVFVEFSFMNLEGTWVMLYAIPKWSGD